MFSIDTDFTITYFEGEAPAREDAISFSDQRGLAKATTGWLTTQYQELWNSFAGVPPFGDLRPVKKFRDRNTAIKRIWQVLSAAWPASENTFSPPENTFPESQSEATITIEETMPKPTKKASVRAQRPAKATRSAAAPASTTRTKKASGSSRKDTVLAMIGRKNGATLAEIMEKTGWQAHSVRGFIATLHTKHGVEIASSKNAAGERVYQATA